MNNLTVFIICCDFQVDYSKYSWQKNEIIKKTELYDKFFTINSYFFKSSKAAGKDNYGQSFVTGYRNRLLKNIKRN